MGMWGGLNAVTTYKPLFLTLTLLKMSSECSLACQNDHGSARRVSVANIYVCKLRFLGHFCLASVSPLRFMAVSPLLTLTLLKMSVNNMHKMPNMRLLPLMPTILLSS